MNVKLKIEELENEVIFLRQTLREDFEVLLCLLDEKTPSTIIFYSFCSI